jgi:hypothetical protein
VDLDTYIAYKEQLATPGRLTPAQWLDTRNEFVQSLQRQNQVQERPVTPKD